MIEALQLTKRYGPVTAVDGVSFRVESGRVTGFLGPNGAGKSTTMRMILGLDRPTAGTATIDGRPYRQLDAPLRSVGAMLDARSVHPGRTARAHLRAIAATHRLPRERVDEVLDLVGLTDVAGRRAGSFSLGMGQRLGIAAALLGDPGTVLLDEPVNGLDPEGVIWMRSLARAMAAEGRAVLISSHLMSEVAQTVDHLVVLGAGRVLADAPLAQVLDEVGGTPTVRIASLDVPRLVPALTAAGGTAISSTAGAAQIIGLPAEQIARIAAGRGVVLTELTTLQRSLEDAYFALTDGTAAHRSSAFRADIVPTAEEASR